MDLLEAIHSYSQSEDSRDGRIYGFIYGKITNVNDSQGIGRVKARIGAQGSNEESDWLLPLWPGSIEAKPNTGDPVVVAFVDGDPHRGLYAWHPKTTTGSRATDFMLLGTTFAGLYNDLVAKFNTLQQNYQTLYGVLTGHTHPYIYGTTSPYSGWSGSNSGTNAGKVLKADGSAVGATAADTTALSGKVKNS